MTFKMWSLFHIAFILSPFIFSYVLFFTTRKLNYEKKKRIGVILSIVCIVLLILRNLEIYLNQRTMHPELIPLQICHFANFVLLIAFLKDNKAMFATAFCFNLPAAMMSIIFANSLENYNTIINFRGAAYIFGHMLIVILTIWAMLAGFMKFKKEDMYKGILFVLVLFVLAIPINNILNNLMPNFTANYFYTIKPEGGTPLVGMYNLGKVIKFIGLEFNLIYVTLLMILGTVVYFSIYLLSQVLNKFVEKRFKY